MGMFALRAQIAYHRCRFSKRHALNPVEYHHFTEFVRCLHPCEDYVFKSQCNGDFVLSALSAR